MQGHRRSSIHKGFSVKWLRSLTFLMAGTCRNRTHPSTVKPTQTALKAAISIYQWPIIAMKPPSATLLFIRVSEHSPQDTIRQFIGVSLKLLSRSCPTPVPRNAYYYYNKSNINWAYGVKLTKQIRLVSSLPNFCGSWAFESRYPFLTKWNIKEAITCPYSVATIIMLILQHYSSWEMDTTILISQT